MVDYPCTAAEIKVVREKPPALEAVSLHRAVPAGEAEAGIAPLRFGLQEQLSPRSNGTMHGAIRSRGRLSGLRRWMAGAGASLSGVFLFWSAGCTAVRYAEQAGQVVELPQQFTRPSGSRAHAERWDLQFDEPALSRLIEKALGQNMTLRAAWARLRQAQALERQARADRWPGVQGRFSASRFDAFDGSFVETFGGGGAFLGTGDGGFGGTTGVQEGFGRGGFSEDEFQGSLAASYEVDLWRRLSNTHRAATWDAQAARSAAEALAVSISAEVAESWFDQIARQETLALLRDQVETSEKRLELIRLRFVQGHANALDVNQQKQQLESLHGRIALAEAELATAAHRVAVLTGEAPREVRPPQTHSLPKLIPVAPPGVPADLLDNRPDVREAHERLAAADRRTAAAVANRLPRITLSASVFTHSEEFSKLFDENFWTASGTLNPSIFDAGFREAEVDRLEAVARERLFQYGQTLLTAVREVQDALVRERQQAVFIDSLQRQVDAAQANLELARDRYVQGAVDYLRVLSALQSVQELQRSMVDARRQLLSARVQLARALGGAWTRALEAPRVSPAPAEMTQRTE